MAGKTTFSLHDMIASAVRESEEDLEKTASVDVAEADEVEAILTGQDTEDMVDTEIEKVASVDALSLADTLEKVGNALMVDENEYIAFQHVLQKLGADGGPGEPVTNEKVLLPQKEQKKDKAKTVTIPTATPMESVNKLKTNEDDDAKTQKVQADNIMKTSAVRRKIKARLQKLAGEDVLAAKISSPKNARNPEDEVGSGQPQQGDRALVASSTAAISFTKRQAKVTPKKVLKDILDEPALSAATDSKLNDNLANTAKAGTKIAQARAGLKKLAAAGCSCRQEGTCGYCQVQAGVKQLIEKRASAGRGNVRIRRALQKKSQFGASPVGQTSMALQI